MTDRKAIIKSLLSHCTNAALRAGAAIMEIYNRNEHCQVALKSDRTPLIDADHAAHIAIREALGATRIPILSEEGREMMYEERKSWELFWLVDPLDGTQEFINRTGEFTVNIALIYNGVVSLSVIYTPLLRRLNFAIADFGSYLKTEILPSADAELTYDDIISGAQRLPLTSSPNRVMRVAVTRSHKNQATEDHIAQLRKCGYPIEIVEQGSSYKFCMLAEGVVDYYIRTSMTYEWDIAAGALILSEAGGETCALDAGQKIEYNKELLENPYFKAYSTYSRIK